MKLLTKLLTKYVSKQIQAGNIKSALNITEKFLETRFENNYYQGICYFEIGDYDQAQFHLELAWELNKNIAVALILGEVYLQQEQWDKALLVLDPYRENAEAKQLLDIIRGGSKERRDYLTFMGLLRQAIRLIHEHEYSNSIQCLKESLPFSKDRGKVYNQIGGIYFNFLKDRNSAEEYFRKAWECSPNNNVFKLNYAKAKLQ